MTVITKIITKKIEVVDKVLCNKCEVLLSENNYAPFGIKEMITYGSKYDGSVISCDLCDNCLDEFIKVFKATIE